MDGSRGLCLGMVSCLNVHDLAMCMESMFFEDLIYAILGTLGLCVVL